MIDPADWEVQDVEQHALFATYHLGRQKLTGLSYDDTDWTRFDFALHQPDHNPVYQGMMKCFSTYLPTVLEHDAFAKWLSEALDVMQAHQNYEVDPATLPHLSFYHPEHGKIVPE